MPAINTGHKSYREASVKNHESVELGFLGCLFAQLVRRESLSLQGA